jgi:endo-1,4-beta-xylanase
MGDVAVVYIADIIISRDGTEVVRVNYGSLVPTENVSLSIVEEPVLPEIIVPPAPLTVIQLRVGDPVFVVGGNRGSMQTSPVVVDGEPYIPLSFIAEITGITEFDALQTSRIDGNEMASLSSVSDVLGIPADWNSTNQTIRISVEGDIITAVEVQPAPQPDAISPLRTLEDHSVPIDFTDIISRSNFDLTRALSGPRMQDAFSDYFSLGVAINGYSISNASINSHEMAAITAYHFNSVSYSNLMKPENLLDAPASRRNAQAGDEAGVAIRFDDAIPGLEFASANGLGMRGHVLVWHTQTPDWFFREGFSSGGDLVDREIMIARLESYIRQVLEFTNENYPGVIYAWDVVNEAVTTARGQFDNSTGWHTRSHWGDTDNQRENMWYSTIGPEYVELAFTFARQYAEPGVMLYYNDYNTFQNDKTQAIVALLTELVEKDLVDGMGMQSAFGLGWPSSLRSGSNSVRQALAAYSALGVEIQMTELTVRVGSPDYFEEQAERYREFFDVVLEMHQANGGPANITNVTFFGLMDNYHLYNNFEQYYWLFDYMLQPKPAFFAVMDVPVAYE